MDLDFLEFFFSSNHNGPRAYSISNSAINCGYFFFGLCASFVYSYFSFHFQTNNDYRVIEIATRSRRYITYHLQIWPSPLPPTHSLANRDRPQLRSVHLAKRIASCENFRYWHHRRTVIIDIRATLFIRLIYDYNLRLDNCTNSMPEDEFHASEVFQSDVYRFM